MALVTCVDCGQEVSDAAAACPMCGRVPRARRFAPNPLALVVGIVLIVYAAKFAWGLLVASHEDDARVSKEAAQGGRDPDEKFCREWLDYYESFCAAYRDNCPEGPKKKARCVPW